MKTLFFTLASLLSTLLAVAQNYPGEMPELLLNRKVRVLPVAENLQKYGYMEFYTTPEMEYNKVYNATKNATPYEALVDKVFTVTEIKPLGTEKSPNYRLTLNSNDGLPVLYHRYNSRFDSGYYFEVIGGLKMPEGYYCNKITSKQVPEGTMYQSKVVRGIILYKQPLAGETTYMIHLSVFGDRAEVNKKGMIITLANGKVISKPQAEVSVTATNGFRYTSTTTLTTAEMKLLSESPIIRAKLFSFSEDKSRTEEIMEYAKCLLK